MKKFVSSFGIQMMTCICQKENMSHKCLIKWEYARLQNMAVFESFVYRNYFTVECKSFQTSELINQTDRIMAVWKLLNRLDNKIGKKLAVSNLLLSSIPFDSKILFASKLGRAHQSAVEELSS